MTNGRNRTLTEVVARETNVSVAKLTEWRDRALAGAASALKERERDDREDEIARLKSKVGEITMDNELPSAKIAGQKPFGPKEVETMSQTVSPSTSRCYGVARVSRAWNVSRAGVYRFLKRVFRRAKFLTPIRGQSWTPIDNVGKQLLPISCHRYHRGPTGTRPSLPSPSTSGRSHPGGISRSWRQRCGKNGVHTLTAVGGNDASQLSLGLKCRLRVYSTSFFATARAIASLSTGLSASYLGKWCSFSNLRSANSVFGPYRPSEVPGSQPRKARFSCITL